MTTSLGLEIYRPMREQQEIIGKIPTFPRRTSATIISAGSSAGGDDISSQHSLNPYQPFSTFAEESSNVNNRGFATSSYQHSSSRPTQNNGSERDSSTWTNTGVSNAFQPKYPTGSSLNYHSEHARESKHETANVTSKPVIQRSHSFGEVSNSDNLSENIIEEKRKRANGEGYTIHRYTRGRLLGKGGFAKVYLCTAMDTGKNYAVKVVPKANLVKARARQKLQAEIKIHRMLKHKHVCQYKHYFEDRNNCYILLELCHNQSLNELIKRRKRLTEPEAAFFISQLLSATRYMHSENVIHRDLKLGNLFLDKDLNIKVGDLGLATRLEDKDEKRKTICGTPNYIAPEIIQGDKSKRGHSFEVDVWSMGVILYTVLVGKPPYEAKDVKATYQRILNNEYSFPRHVEVSEKARNLISSMLQSNPADRPTLDQIEAHSFLSESPIPTFLPSSAMTVAPVWRVNEIGEVVCTEETQSQTSKKHLFPPTTSRQPFASRDPNMAKASSTTTPNPKGITSGAEINMERIGRNALAAMTATNATNVKGKPTVSSYSPAFKIFDEMAGVTNLRCFNSKSPPEILSPKLTAEVLEVKNGKIPALHLSPTASTESNSRGGSSNRSPPQSLAEEILLARTRALSIHCQNSRPTSNKSITSSVHTNATSSVFTNPENDVDVLKKMADHLDAVLEITESRRGSYGNVPLRPLSARRGPSKWVTRYVDYTSKYGLGFLLNDGSSGVYFNDTTKTALEAEGDTFQYIERKKIEDDGTPRRGETILQTFTLDSYPESLKKKVTLLKHFRNYLIDQHKKTDITDVDNNTYNTVDFFGVSELVYVKKWVRTKHAIMFFLSNKTVQVIFYDQTEVLFTPDIAFLTYVDKNRARFTYNFTDELVGSTPEIEKRLKYTKEIMIQLLSGHRS